MTYEILYTESKETVLKVLVSMKKYLDQYRIKPEAKESIITMNENRMIAIAEFVKASNYTILELEKSISLAYKRGFEAGKKYNNNNHSSIKKVFDNYNKEDYRMMMNEQKRQQWHDHF